VTRSRGERGSNAKRADVDLEIKIAGDSTKVATIEKANDAPGGTLIESRLPLPMALPARSLPDLSSSQCLCALFCGRQRRTSDQGWLLPEWPDHRRHCDEARALCSRFLPRLVPHPRGWGTSLAPPNWGAAGHPPKSPGWSRAPPRPLCAGDFFPRTAVPNIEFAWSALRN